VIKKDESQKLAGQFFKRIISILEQENVEYDKKVVSEVVIKFFPDFRKTLNELQKYSLIGKIDVGILASFDHGNFASLLEYVKDKNFTEVRRWVTNNTHIEYEQIFRELYNMCYNIFEKESIPELILLISKYQNLIVGSPDKEIDLMAFLIEVMSSCRFL
jgi:hypothetical protein